jgi:hypothetical protein
MHGFGRRDRVEESQTGPTVFRFADPAGLLKSVATYIAKKMHGDLKHVLGPVQL